MTLLALYASFLPAAVTPSHDLPIPLSPRSTSYRTQPLTAPNAGGHLTVDLDEAVGADRQALDMAADLAEAGLTTTDPGGSVTQRATTGTEPREHTDPWHRSTDHAVSASTVTRHLLGLQEARERSLTRTTVDGTLQRLAGPAGLACAAAPTIAFVITEAISGLTPAVIALLVTAMTACVIRLVRRESPGAAVAGLVVAAVCAGVAAVSGEARDFFLPAMVVPVLFLLAYSGSLLARRPLMGLLVNPLTGGPRRWRTHRRLRRLSTVSTLVGLGLAGLTLSARILFYLADQPAALAVVQVASTTSFAVHFALTLVLAHRSAGVPVQAIPAQ